MIQTQLIIYDNASGIVKYEIDLYEDVPLELTKQISDISDPQSRNADYTKTIKVPATANNNKIFNYIFDLARFTRNDSGINFNTDFSPIYKANAMLYKNSVLQSVGYIQLTNIVKLPNNSYEYEINFIGRVKNIITDIENKYLSDIDLSEFDHTLDYDTVVASWDYNHVSGFVYPLIDYGQVTQQDIYKLNNLYPSVFVRTIIDKIFTDAGYTYQSNFFNTDMFKSLILPFSNGQFRLTEQQVENRTGIYSLDGAVTGLTEASFNGTNPADLLPYILVPLDYIDKDTSPSGFNTTTSKYTVPTNMNGTYHFNIDGSVTIKNNSASTKSYSFRFSVIIEQSGVPYAFNTQFISTDPIAASGSQTISFDFPLEFSGNFIAGDIVYAVVWVVGLDWELSLNNNLTFTIYPNAAVNTVEGTTISLASSLSTEIKQSDLLIWLIKMFNLYIEPDKYDDRKLIIEPRNTFYDASAIVNWTNKVDYSRDINIKPLGALKNKTYLYQYEEDDDKFNKRYKNASEYTYGHRKFDIVNDFVTDEDETKIGFAPTPLADFPSLHSRITTQIATDNNDGKLASVKPRILFYKKYQFTDAPDKFWVLDTIEYGALTISTYPYAGHIDDVFTPNYDLSFGIPTEFYYNVTTYTNNNLFNLYWKTYIQQISDPDSKLVEMHVYLNELDIYNLSFRSYYLIDRQLYILQSINYDLNSSEPAKCEFLKLPNKYSFSGQSVTINGGGGAQVDNESIGVWDATMGKSGNNYGKNTTAYEASIFLAGADNIAGSQGTIINGDSNNAVGTHVTILGGSDNNAALDNVTIIGSEGQTATINNETIINNVQHPFGKTIRLTPTQLDALNTTPVELVPEADGYLIEYVSAYAVLEYGSTAYAGHKLTIYQEQTTDEPISETNTSFTSSTESIMTNFSLIDKPNFTKDRLMIEASGDLTASGDSDILIVIQYRLIKI